MRGGHGLRDKKLPRRDGAAKPMIGNAKEPPGFGVHIDRVGVALAFLRNAMTQLLQLLHQHWVILRAFEAHHVGEPLMMKPRRRHRLAQVHFELDDVEHHAQ